MIKSLPWLRYLPAEKQLELNNLLGVLVDDPPDEGFLWYGYGI